MILLINFGFNKELGAMKRVINFVLLAGLLSVSSGLASCSLTGFECDQNVQAVLPSPNGNFVAKVLLVQCGATTADATWVLLASSGTNFDGDKDKVAVFEGGVIEASWRGETLNIDFKNSKIFKMEREKNGAVISYNGESIGKGSRLNSHN